jgi:putative phosphoesterase
VQALLYDVHGNLPALEAVLADAQDAGAESFVLGGDYAFAGAWPNETIALLRELDALWIRGNGERWTLDPGSAPDQELIQRALAYVSEQLGDDVVAELGDLPERAEVGDVLFCHGSPRSDVATFGPQPADSDEQLLEGAGHGVVVFGHSHIQFSRRGAERLLVNPGSVGMPFDGDRRAAYGLWSGEGEFQLRRVEYDVGAYARDVRDRLSAPLGDSVGALVQRIERAEFVS